MKEKQVIHKNNGGKNMKRTFLVLALACALVFAFSAVAGAKYAGYSKIDSKGFVSWSAAQTLMGNAVNNAPAAIRGTAHGGYVTTTTKCATCHSVHRAPAVNPGAVQGTTTALANKNNREQAFLTAGSDTCINCHVDWGSQASSLLVEWGRLGTQIGGPHTSNTSSSRGCQLCHNSGIHGGGTSRYHVMNVFMLGSTTGRGDRGTNSVGLVANDDRDAMIAAEEAKLVSRYLNASSAAGTSMASWWANGTSGITSIGGLPADFYTTVGDTTSNPISGAATYFAAAKALATNYTCAVPGCHNNTVMLNLNAGMGFDRQINGTRNPDTVMTGHVLPLYTSGNGPNRTSSCGTCHPGGAAGFPTASTVVGVQDNSRAAYGCDQCHDMVGVATNSTAFPHGNRNIKVYEWELDGAQVETTLNDRGGNLWMYAGNIARSNVPGIPTGNSPTWPTTAGGAYRGPTSVNVGFADWSWKVLTGVTDGQNAEGTAKTGLMDGACLKCHVAIDAKTLAQPAASMPVYQQQAADALRHSWTDTGGGTKTGNEGRPTGSKRLFLYK